MKESKTGRQCWEAFAEAWRLNLPPERLAAIDTALDSFARETRAALDMDLFSVEPTFSFHPIHKADRR